MTTVSEQPDSSAQPEPAGMSLQTDQAKAMVKEMKSANAALKEADQAAEAQAEVVVEQAQELAKAVEEVLEELQEVKSGSDHE
jgi:RNA-splicing ligase RtcB